MILISDGICRRRPAGTSGLGPKPIPISALIESRLTAALEHCLPDSGIKQAVKKTGKAINPQKFLGRIVEPIETSS
jgi:hypothetical protein